jgi:hypothetical protein
MVEVHVGELGSMECGGIRYRGVRDDRTVRGLTIPVGVRHDCRMIQNNIVILPKNISFLL